MFSIDWNLIHPVARGQFIALANDLAEGHHLGIYKTLILPFEGWRSPVDQQKAFDKKVSKARPWQSAHQYGLAVDFVPKINGKWVWGMASDPHWADLRKAATARGLRNVIDWDRPHVEHPVWMELQAALYGDPPGLAA